MLVALSVLAIGCDQRSKPASSENTNTTMSSNVATDDSAITQKVRQAISDDSTLSANAKSITVSTSNGTVTLKGSVASDSEKSKIYNIADGVQGVKQVDNQLEIKK